VPYRVTTRRNKASGFDRLMARLSALDRSRRAHRSTRRGNVISNNFYLPQLIPALLLVAFGLVVQWSASLSISEASLPRQVVGVLIGLALAALLWHYDYRAFAAMRTPLLIIDAILLLLPSLPFIGVSAKGMTGWVQIPGLGVRFQPSELAKLVTILMLASAASDYNGKIKSFEDYARLCGLLLIPLILIMTQPDLGTGLIILITGACIIICGGADSKWVLATIALIVIATWFVIFSFMTDGMPHIMKEYQLNRLLVFVDPSVDPTGDGYNLQQAKIAVGSGGLFGRGIANATQTISGFLPEAHTDFVFALLSEEFGFIGALTLLLLFGWMILATVSLALKVEPIFAKLILVGVIAMWSFQVLENVGMCIGIMPITGIPLPFISFGSSSMVAQLMAVGLVQSIYHYRTKPA
jgi:rod shape determining protein RodA